MLSAAKHLEIDSQEALRARSFGKMRLRMTIAVFVIRTVSAFFRAMGMRACRFYPSCSDYAVQAFSRVGFFNAGALMIRRLAKCHPFCEGGYDPLPIKETR